MSEKDTLDRLWKTLGLDSLPPDAGSAEDLGSTRVPDWEKATLQHQAVPKPPTTERIDLPKISLTPPPASDDEKQAIHRDLVVTGLLGEGGMGRVLLAHQASLGRDVAVKVPRPNASLGTINALISEAKTTGGLEHPGVIPVYSLASDAEGHPALVMKRVDGVSWSMLIRHAEDPAWNRIAGSGGDRIDTHVELLRHVCNAIAFAHRKGVLHRDIKPSNVLIEGALLGLDVRQTAMQNFLMVAAICVLGGVTLHWGFFWSAGAIGLGFIIATFVGFEPQIFGVSVVGALVFAVLSWRGWKGEFSLKREE